MAYEPKDGDISAFPNDKQGNDKRPDYRGDALIGGKKYRVSFWWKQGRSGDFLSGKIEPAQDRGQQQGAAPRRPQAPRLDPILSEDPPF